MLAQEMLVVQFARKRPGFSIDRQSVRRHACHVFQNHRIVGGFRGIGAPAKGSVSGDQHRRNRVGIELGKRAANRGAGFQFVVAGNFCLSQPLGDRNRTVKIVGMRSAEAWNRGLGLGPGSRIFRVRMRNAADVWEMLVQLQMRRQIGGGAKVAVHDLAGEVGNHNLLRR